MPSNALLLASDPINTPRNTLVTEGKGIITQWVHGEFIVSFETICPVNTHQVCVEYFKKVTLHFTHILPTGYMVGTL